MFSWITCNKCCNRHWSTRWNRILHYIIVSKHFKVQNQLPDHFRLFWDHFRWNLRYFLGIVRIPCLNDPLAMPALQDVKVPPGVRCVPFLCFSSCVCVHRSSHTGWTEVLNSDSLCSASVFFGGRLIRGLEFRLPRLNGPPFLRGNLFWAFNS